MKKLDQEHRCVAAKCKGALAEPVANYGRWAYWRRGGDRQWRWYATPSKSPAPSKRRK